MTYFNIRGASGAGKSTAIKRILERYYWRFVDDPPGHFVPQLDATIVGRYYDDCERYLWEAQLDDLSMGQLRWSLLESIGSSSAVFECGRASSSFGPWRDFANGLDDPFHGMLFACLDTSLEQCKANRDRRKREHGTANRGLAPDGSPRTKLVEGTHASELKSRAKLLNAGLQVIVGDVDRVVNRVVSICQQNVIVSSGDEERSQGMIDWLKTRALYVSGGGKRSGSRSEGLYTTITVPPFDDIEGVRDSAKRLDDFGLTSDEVKGKSIVELGSNAGGLSFELLRRGARDLRGFEYNADRVDFCNDVARYSGFTNGRFVSADFREDLLDVDAADVVVCCSVDEYLDDDDRRRLYAYCRQLTNERCFFESDAQDHPSPEFTASRLHAAGFARVEYLGRGDGGRHSRKRHCFVCSAR